MKLPFKITRRRENLAAQAQLDARVGPRSLVWDPALISDSSLALQVATVYRCVEAICSSVAGIPLEYQKKTSAGIFEAETSSNFNYLLGCQPNPDYTWYDFMGQAIRQMLVGQGFACIIPVWSTSPTTMGNLESLVLCSNGTVSYDEMARSYTVNDAVNGIEGVFPESDVVVLKNQTLGRRGVSVLSYARIAASTSRTGDMETLKRFSNGGTVRGIVGNDNSVRGFGEYADNELNKTAEDLDTKFCQGQRIVSLPGQVQFNQLSMSSVDMEFLSTRKFGVREICRFFGVPPTYVFDDTSNNYKSAEMADAAFLSQTIGPLLTKIEQEFQRKLIAPHRYGKYRFRFDRKAIYSLDLSTLADYQKKTIESGIYTINEWRSYENKKEVENGDQVLVSANLKGLDSLLSETGPAPQTVGQGNKTQE